MNPAQEIDRLRRAIEDRDETIRRLRETIAGGAFDIPGSWGLTRAEATLFRALVRREIATVDLLVTALWGDEWQIEDPESALRAHLSRLRLKLAPHGLGVRAERGLGYRLTGRETLQEILPC